MTKGRRNVGIEDAPRWVFNRIADVYSARPEYPSALVDALAELAGPAPSSVGDIGAGIGHLALPLAARGHDVVAVEPAAFMLKELRERAAACGVAVRALAGTAEALPLEDASLDLAIVSDALHFMNPELAPRELARVLGPRGALAVVTSQLGATPFMQAVARVMEQASQRRPRLVSTVLPQVCAMTGVPFTVVRHFHDETPVDREWLERILRSVSFIGPAMNPERFAAFRQRIHALSDAPVWARTFTLHAGRRGWETAPRGVSLARSPAGGQ